MMAAIFMAAMLVTSSAEEIPVAVSLRTGFALAASRLVDIDGDGRSELLALGQGGEVRVWRAPSDPEAPWSEGKGTLVLRHAARTLLDIGNVRGDAGPPQLIALSPEGLAAYRVTPDGGFDETSPETAALPKLELRLGAPRFAEFLRDVNGDGRSDLVVPGPEACELWSNESCAEGESAREGENGRFRRTARVRTDVRYVHSLAGSALSDQLESAFFIPILRLTDLNGDGRPDLMVVAEKRRTFHLQRSDGSIPEEPDSRLDLEAFRDTTPEAELRPGKALAGTEEPRLQVEDLDRDGIPDYMISHRRKLWIFHGTREEGAQFTHPTTILKVADDITELLATPLDGDSYPDLLLLRVQVPTIAGLVKGLFAELEVPISASGYASRQGRSFAETPTWKGEITVLLPEVLGLFRNPEALFGRLEATARKLENALSTDLDGDGREDVAMVSDDGSSLTIWRGVARDARTGDSTGGDSARTGAVGPDSSALRELFFESQKRHFTLDEVIGWLGGAAERRAARASQGRDPDARVALRDPQRFHRLALAAADLEGKGRNSIVVTYQDMERHREGVFDIYRWHGRLRS
ncbi:MAG: VCBS repeat-containing protein [Planctomycetota bacterium]